MTHGIDTSFLVAIEVSSHAEHARTRAQFQKIIKDHTANNKTVTISSDGSMIEFVSNDGGMGMMKSQFGQQNGKRDMIYKASFLAVKLKNLVKLASICQIFMKQEN